jgi:hypothetical protein
LDDDITTEDDELDPVVLGMEFSDPDDDGEGSGKDALFEWPDPEPEPKVELPSSNAEPLLPFPAELAASTSNADPSMAICPPPSSSLWSESGRWKQLTQF